MEPADIPSSSEPPKQDGAKVKQPVVLLVVGMAGSGKTTFMQRLCAYLNETSKPSYVINLDPAVAQVPYGVNIDICDTVNYKEVMKQYVRGCRMSNRTLSNRLICRYGLGPNGGILTSLNLFATRFNNVMEFVEKRAPSLE